MNSTAQKIKKYLNQSHVHYWINDSNAVFGDSEEYKSAVDGVVFSLLVIIDGEPAMVVLSSDEEFEPESMRIFLHKKAVKIAADGEVYCLFPECDDTALPALGSAYGMPVYCSRHVLQKKKICFNSGTHDEIIQLATSDFVRLAHPVVGNFTHPAAASPRAAYYW